MVEDQAAKGAAISWPPLASASRLIPVWAAVDEGAGGVGATGAGAAGGVVGAGAAGGEAVAVGAGFSWPQAGRHVVKTRQNARREGSEAGCFMVDRGFVRGDESRLK